jgi:hypothetical protein
MAAYHYIVNSKRSIPSLVTDSEAAHILLSKVLRDDKKTFTKIMIQVSLC